MTMTRIGLQLSLQSSTYATKEEECSLNYGTVVNLCLQIELKSMRNAGQVQTG